MTFPAFFAGLAGWPVFHQLLDESWRGMMRTNQQGYSYADNNFR